MKLANYFSPTFPHSTARVVQHVILFITLIAGVGLRSSLVVSANAVLTVVPSPSPEWLVNVDFGYGLTGSSAKVGPAVIGQEASDFWNFYTRDDGTGGWKTLGTLAGLKQADGSATQAGLIVANAPGAWDNPTSDEMYRSVIYPLNGGNATVTLTNLPANSYDVYVYGSDAHYDLSVGADSQGTQTTFDNPMVNPTVWEEGRQYVVFRDVMVEAGQPLQVVARPSVGRYAVIAGLQLKGASATGGIPPSISDQPQDTTVAEGTTASFAVEAEGTPPLTYQWLFEGGEISDATNSALVLSNVQPAQAGSYSVVVSNPFGVAVSANAVLAVDRLPVADASATLTLVISPDNTNATVVLDGTLSDDPDGDLLTYTWFLDGSADVLAGGVVAAVELPIGTHPVILRVDDGMGSDTDSIIVEVITLSQAAEKLLEAVTESGAGNGQSLIASLRAALASIDRSNPIPAINQLQAFQSQVQTQVAPEDPALAAEFIQQAQDIIDSLAEGALGSKNLKALANQETGQMEIEFMGSPGKLYIIEASSDLVNWEMIGVGRHKGNGDFDFQDVNADHYPCRYYRVTEP